MEIKLQKSIYPIEAVRNTIYWMSEDLAIVLSEEENFYIVSSTDFDDLNVKKFLKSLNDFALREQINVETRDIKNLVISKAFYPDLINFKDIGEFDDPINILNKHGN
ncbi:His-Xaa-Ser system protein HxsD [Flavobacterium sp. 14A]|uniref:His-Xaa-Ser system protein HxsD n=1 Tax=Flavobacterium sp. 14A TaxID=2735896 RepID=UPI00156FB31B|nr:His-Xaa-Ser system protein HxsD [Flavobacterium sp. 14A]NRT13133.1 His-Xaa-Ser system protein HxsD [Flavobacterium sp. 14A]